MKIHNRVYVQYSVYSDDKMLKKHEIGIKTAHFLLCSLEILLASLWT